MSSSSSISATSSPAWSDLLPELLGRVIAYLPFPADCARLRAVCRAWHSAAREHMARRQLPWVVLPDGSFCTIGDGGAFHCRIHSLPRDVTCLGATDSWLALDRTDDVLRRTNLQNTLFLGPRRGVKHRHAYSLQNPFSGETVPLPELDSIAGDAAETFEIRKVLMRSNSLDAVVAVTTNNWYYPVILCRPGKGRCVIRHLYIYDVAFFGGHLYGLAPENNLVAFDLAEDSNGRPIVTKYKRVIRHPLADGEEDVWSWMYDCTYIDDYSGDGGQADDGDGLVPNGKVMVTIEDEEDPPYEAIIEVTRYLVESCGGELLLVKHYVQTPSRSRWYEPYTFNVEVFKADIDAGKWIPVGGLAEGEALFLSRSFCKSIRAFGDIKEGLIYFVDTDDVFDTISWTCWPVSLPWQRELVPKELLTWLFPPEVVI